MKNKKKQGDMCWKLYYIIFKYNLMMIKNEIIANNEKICNWISLQKVSETPVK